MLYRSGNRISSSRSLNLLKFQAPESKTSSGGLLSIEGRNVQTNSSDGSMGQPFTPQGNHFPPIEPAEFDIFLSNQLDMPPERARIPNEFDGVQPTVRA